MSFSNKVLNINQLFTNCHSKEEIYNTIIELGRNSEAFSDQDKVEANLVRGCQSTMYLRSWAKDGSIYFQAWSDALISAGLAQLLILAYTGETPEVILKEPPNFLDELDIPSSLTPNRINGLSQIHLKMKQEALKHISSL